MRPSGRARLVHVSTDCVFTGTRGNYREADIPDAGDLYGRSKLLGEVDEAHATTLRTSIIGEELAGPHGLVGWFLSQKGPVRVSRAPSSQACLPSARALIRDHVLRLQSCVASTTSRRRHLQVRSAAARGRGL